jgi:hypothetical protein
MIVNSPVPTEQVIAEALRNQIPIKDLPGVSIRNVQQQPEQPFDISFELRSGPNKVQVMGEIKSTFSPRSLEEIAPWIQRLKSLRGDVAVAVIASALSPQAQAFCAQNGIDFMDLAGNVSINVPGKFTLQRSGMRARGISVPDAEGQRTINVFSGRTSRILRVLLEKPKSWTISDIARELTAESVRFREIAPGARIDFGISLGSVSKAIASLEDQLWVRRRGADIVVSEPSRLLQQWGEKYKERYRWRLRRSFQTNNPFGRDLQSITQGLEPLASSAYAFSGAIAASTEASFVDIDVIDIFLSSTESDLKLRDLKSQSSIGPALRFIYPYDDGAFMYSKRIGKALVVSGVQAYLDLHARGGRDLKQAEFLLSNSIQPRWGAA